ncbi:MAG: hypothetical protein A2849_04210 [Candidatus Taylorbacteria bacterium RIFCSPHIGHO2_01_FULL_51_15]|uniref:Uncharacterized protein n=1 Tax=Candidatus Taylorbacteria bacterium RIFCSPHIGHO2_01_FULL_51_15 TaxID=1802304 RepID=A0A1G2MAK7_9BACT|nr:MAG: hypothetical protein A2849_04210 [Candidatus Taylorbacteria bacterium RIFCSPHIGHO2_01_FULL_51_15]
MSLIYQKQSDIFEKTVRRGGKLFLVRFVIVERCGQLRGKVLSCEPVEELAGCTMYDLGCKDKNYFLPVRSKGTTPVADTKTTVDEIVSPYTTLEFFMSQMTRAPSL